MFRLFFLLVCCIQPFCLLAQADNPAYNKALADSLGADERGMKMYVLVMAGHFDVELYPFYGSAALPMHVPIHARLQKKKN